MLLAMTAITAVLAEFSVGDVVSMEYRTRQIEGSGDGGGSVAGKVKEPTMSSLASSACVLVANCPNILPV